LKDDLQIDLSVEYLKKNYSWICCVFVEFGTVVIGGNK